MAELPGFGTFLLAVMPWPAWPDFMDPDFRPGEEVGAGATSPDQFGAAVQNHFRFLGDSGFQLAPAEQWTVGTSCAVAYLRADVSVLVVSREMASMFVLVAQTPDAQASPEGILQTAVRSGSGAEGLGRYGSFPLLAGRADPGPVVARHASAFRDVAGPLLAHRPADVHAVASALEAALEPARESVWAAHYRRRAHAAWEEGRMSAALAYYRRLGEIEELSPEERRRSDDAVARAQESRHGPVRTTEADAEWILRRADHLNRAQQTLAEAFSRRDSGPAGLAAWEVAALEAEAAVEFMYPEDFRDDLHRLQAGDPGAVEAALVFLEADPWCFRSGYAKETIVRLLARHRLNPGQHRRLEDVFRHVVEAGDRREFSAYCRLARHKATPRLRAELKRRLEVGDPGTARRALLMLTALRHPRLDPDELVRARQIVLNAARRRDRPFWIVPSWVRRLSARFWSEEWAAQLVGLAVGYGDDTDAARRLLAGHPVELHESQRRALARSAIEVVDTGGDESWFEELVS